MLHDKTDGQPVNILGHGKVVQGEDQFHEVEDPVTGDPMHALREYALKHTSSDAAGALDDFRRALGAIGAELDGEKRTRVLARGGNVDDSRIFQRFARAHEKG